MLVIVTGPSSVGKSTGLSYWASQTTRDPVVVNLDSEFTPIGRCTVERECRPVLDGFAARSAGGLTVVDVGAGTQNQEWFWEWLDACPTEAVHAVVWAPAEEVYPRNQALLAGKRTFADFKATEYGDHRHPDKGNRIDVGGLSEQGSRAKVAARLEELLSGCP